ncbi:hypothetical protein C823_002350 [Eubacterium plexicaudatum ASF492]|nr:hypothetical protein C823_002350 [Eubacterium plexicaudatum ASF492]
MNRHFPNKAMRTACVAALFILLLYSGFRQNENQSARPNQSALLFRYSEKTDSTNVIPLKIDDGVLYEYHTDTHAWSAMKLDGMAAQVFSGERLCVLMEGGSLFYEGQDLSPDEDNLPLTAGYSRYMAGKALEYNKTEPFLGVNGNLEYPDFMALLQAGELLCEDEDDFKRVSLPRETPAAMSGSYVLTEGGNVYYMHNGIENVYDGGDIVAISASETAARCAGLKENGEAVLWWMDIEAPDVSEWKNLAAVRHGFNFVAGLRGMEG